MKATARAHPNIALVKYWGKRDEAKVLPHTGSLSMALEALGTTTTVEFCEDARDRVAIDGRPAAGEELARVVKALDPVRPARGPRFARVESINDFPRAAGLASSASGGAALAAAAAWAAGLGPSEAELSVMARLMSGSACRSVPGAFAEWRRGEAPDGSDSIAVRVAGPEHWPQLRMAAVVCAEEAKDVSSRDAMRRCVRQSPYFPAWVEAATADLAAGREALLARDLDRLGAICERNAWRMHACALAADPPIVFLRPGTLAVIQAVQAMRAAGVPAWFTLDAGPNPVVLCLAEDAPRVEERLGQLPEVRRIVVSGPGGGVARLDRHLF